MAMTMEMPARSTASGESVNGYGRVLPAGAPAGRAGKPQLWVVKLASLLAAVVIIVVGFGGLGGSNSTHDAPSPAPVVEPVRLPLPEPPPTPGTCVTPAAGEDTCPVD
jgi:hypothetical protein